MNSLIWQADLSIVIPAMSEESVIGQTLKSLCNAFPRAEIIVVDDGSTDDTARIVLDWDN